MLRSPQRSMVPFSAIQITIRRADAPACLFFVVGLGSRLFLSSLFCPLLSFIFFSRVLLQCSVEGVLLATKILTFFCLFSVYLWSDGHSFRRVENG